MKKIMHKTFITALLILSIFVRLTSSQHATNPINVLAATIPVDIESGIPLVHVRILNNDYMFVIDTGTTNLIYDRSLRPILGPVREIVSFQAINATFQTELFDAPKATLGPLDLQTTEKVFCSDLSNLRKAINKDVFGVIGMSFLKNCKFTIDINKKTVVFYKEFNCPSEKSTKLDITYMSRIPALDLSLPGEAMEHYLIDTGYNGGITVTSGVFSRQIDGKNLRLGGYVRSIDLSNKETTDRTGILITLKVQDKDIQNLKCTEVSKQTVRVGFDLLRKNSITFDFPNKTLYMENQ